MPPKNLVLKSKDGLKNSIDKDKHIIILVNRIIDLAPFKCRRLNYETLSLFIITSRYRFIL